MQFSSSCNSFITSRCFRCDQTFFTTISNWNFTESNEESSLLLFFSSHDGIIVYIFFSYEKKKKNYILIGNLNFYETHPPPCIYYNIYKELSKSYNAYSRKIAYAPDRTQHTPSYNDKIQWLRHQNRNETISEVLAVVRRREAHYTSFVARLSSVSSLSSYKFPYVSPRRGSSWHNTSIKSKWSLVASFRGYTYVSIRSGPLHGRRSGFDVVTASHRYLCAESSPFPPIVW